jgi:hypothetical protein
MRFLVRASYLQIYNEAISDLLKPERSNLNIREDKKRGVYVDGLSEWVVRSPAEIYGLMERGGAVRATGETKVIYAYLCIYICIFIYMYIYMYTYIYIFMYINICICMYIHSDLHTYKKSYIYVYSHRCIFTYMYIHIDE